MCDTKLGSPAPRREPPHWGTHSGRIIVATQKDAAMFLARVSDIERRDSSLHAAI